MNPLDKCSKESIKDERPVLSATSVPTYVDNSSPRPFQIPHMTNNIVTSKTSKKEKHLPPLNKITIKLTIIKKMDMNNLFVQCVFIHVLMTAIIIECW